MHNSLHFYPRSLCSLAHPRQEGWRNEKSSFSLGKRGRHDPNPCLEPSQGCIPGLGPSHSPGSDQTTLNKERKFNFFFFLIFEQILLEDIFLQHHKKKKKKRKKMHNDQKISQSWTG